jgi:divalent metal cation (Fe/Co/Zn/Cd) transporter
MNIDRVVFAFAGSIVLLSVALGYFVSPWWLLLALFVGANLLQSAFTGFCPLAKILSGMGLKPGCAFRS